MSWDDDQEFERGWWGDCTNTYTEEGKQTVYARRMKIPILAGEGKWPCYDLGGKSVLDVGGGPVSMLLKGINRGEECAVLDPCEYPHWVSARYMEAEITYYRQPAEEMVQGGWDEVWIYNVLQHTQNPEEIIRRAKLAAPRLRIFEWIDTPASPGHPHTLTRVKLNSWIGGLGNVEVLNESNCVGTSYYGVFDFS